MKTVSSVSFCIFKLLLLSVEDGCMKAENTAHGVGHIV